MVFAVFVETTHGIKMDQQERSGDFLGDNEFRFPRPDGLDAPKLILPKELTLPGAPVVDPTNIHVRKWSEPEGSDAASGKSTPPLQEWMHEHVHPPMANGEDEFEKHDAEMAKQSRRDFVEQNINEALEDLTKARIALDKSPLHMKGFNRLMKRKASLKSTHDDLMKKFLYGFHQQEPVFMPYSKKYELDLDQRNAIFQKEEESR